MGTYVITEACIGVKDGRCVDVCPAACIHTTPDAPQFYIDPDVCIECEQCLEVCPVNAIYTDVDVPAGLQHYLEINAEFFRGAKAEPRPLDEEDAEHIVAAVQTYARGLGAAVSVAVARQDGAIVAEVSMADAPADAVASAAARAYTSAVVQLPTNTPRAFWTPPSGADQARLTAESGGFPILDGVVIVGSVGVAGCSSPQLDMQCAQAGLAARRGVAPQ